MTYLYKDLHDMRQQMFDAQCKKGFDLTVRDLMQVWQLDSVGAVHYRLKLLEDAMMVKTHSSGKNRHVYRALPY